MTLILHEDEHLLVINKPAGWNTHAPSPFAGEGVYDWLKHREPRWAKLAIIHRLDKETSGVLVFGKTPIANRSLTEQFAARTVLKKYLLLTDRTLEREKFTATSTLVRAGEKYVSRPLRAGGERAETRFAVVMVSDGSTLIEASPITGRTHQIRVHAAAHGFPILGDALYGGTKAERVFLHAAELSLTHPVSRMAMTFRSETKWSVPPTSCREGIANEPTHSNPSPQEPGRMPGARLGGAVIDLKFTNACRLIHGAIDGWPGLYVEQLGEFLLAQGERALSASQLERLTTLSRECGTRGVYYKLLNRSVGRTSVVEASPHLLVGEPAPDRFPILENGLTFELSFKEGYSVGLFLDQRDNRRRLLVNHVAADFTLFTNGAVGAHVLNTFAYTCGFAAAAARAGAVTTNLDLSKKYLEWGQRNFALNGIDPAGHDFIYGDALDWMRRLAKKGRAFDCVILDPPTFSQSKESGTWQAEKHYGRLVEAALPLLKPGGVLFASTNAAKLEPEEFLDVIGNAVVSVQRKIVQQHYVPQPPDFPITRAEPAYLKTVWLRVS